MVGALRLMGDVVQFTPKPKNPKSNVGKPLTAEDIDVIGFLTKDDRSIWIKNKVDIAKILIFITRNNITIFEGE